MVAGDFSSLVQLGVGIHAGTAILQIFSEFGIQPIERRLNTLLSYASAPENGVSTFNTEALNDLKSDITIFKINAFKNYRRYVIANFAVAGILLLILVAISFDFNRPLNLLFAVILAILCCFPSPYCLFQHWRQAKPSLRKLRDRIKELEDKIFSPQTIK